MELICYLHPSWRPLIRPAPATRPWMDATPESFAYRCLPLNIANAHGWEILSPVAFEAQWSGESGVEAVQIRLDAGAEAARGPVSLFGQGVLTFHVEGLFRTPPGWNLWIGGSPNRPKDAIAPLTGVVETDWSPFTFTLNWRFTRPHTPVRFEAMEPIGFIFPAPRAALEEIRPRFEPMAASPETLEGFAAWSRARDTFHAQMSREAPAAGSDRWQKHYYRGVDVAGDAHIGDHRAKLRLAPFDTAATPHLGPATQKETAAPQSPRANDVRTDAERDLAKRDWLLQASERQRALWAPAASVERRAA